MAKITITHTIRPAPGADGPYYVVTESVVPSSGVPPAVSNVTLGLANINAAIDQCKTDGAALLPGYTISSIVLNTFASNGS